MRTYITKARRANYVHTKTDSWGVVWKANTPHPGYQLFVDGKMIEEKEDRIHELQEQLYTEVHNLVDSVLDSEDPEVADEVRQHMTEQFRFWKR